MTDKAPTTDIVERLAFLAAHVADDGTLQDAIGQIKSLQSRVDELEAQVAEYDNLKHDIAKIYDANTALLNPWISVEDELPDCMQRNCLSYDGDEMSWAFYTSDGRWAIGNSIFEDITHWMPLPEPRK